MSSVVPAGWITSNLDLVTKTVFSNVDKKSYADETPVLLCNYMDVYGNSYITKSIEFMPATAKQREIDKFSLEYDDVMITKDSETPQDIAVPAHVSEQLEGVLCGYHLALIRTDKQKLSGGFLSHLLSLDSIQRRFYRLANGSTRFGLTAESINKAELTVPPLPEQKKIASILTSVDEVIENTQKQIDKLQDLKKATMNELLTKGIGHTEFKDSELGRIPKSWGISNIGKLTQFVTSGSRGWSQYYSSEGSLFIRIGNLTRDHINLKFADIQLVEPPSGGEGTRTKVKVGDILVSITADLGVIGVVNESLREAYVNQHVCLVRLESVSDVNPRWVGHFLSGHAGQEQFEKKNDGGAKAGLNLPTIRSIVVPLPSPQEQNKVVRVLDRLDSEISIKQTKLAKHQSLKKSLMQDLLTGKVRVTVN
jgi:type I restriction enzyme, S subunit